jgi:hypothetical protein
VPEPGEAPASTRGRVCRKCGADDWLFNKQGHRACRVCQRRIKSAGKRRQIAADPALGLFWHARQRAKQKGLPFTITVDDVRAVYPEDGKCPVLGLTLLRGTKGAPVDTSPTLDRLNNQWGYEPGNICVISHRANRAKSTLTARELEQIANWMKTKGLD